MGRWNLSTAFAVIALCVLPLCLSPVVGLLPPPSSSPVIRAALLPHPSPHPASSLAGEWFASPTCVPETEGGVCDAPLLGNGDLGAAVSSLPGTSTVRFHLGLNQFWSLNSTEHLPAQSQRRMVAVVALTFPGQLTFDGRQFLYNGSLALHLRSQATQFHLQASIAPDSNLLLVHVTSTPLLTHLQVNVSTSTLGPFPVRRGSVGGLGQYLTRDSFWPNASFPITAAVVTRWLGEGVEVTGQLATATSVTTTLSVVAPQAASLTFAVVVATNLDAAGLNQSSFDPPAPVLGVDPLPLAQKTAMDLTLSTVQAVQAATAQEWATFWANTCIVRLPDTPWLERYYYGAQYILHASTRRGKAAPGLWGPWVLSDQPNWEGDYTLNYNYQAAFYGAYSSNQMDLASASYPPMLAYLPQARLNARQLHNCTSPLCIHFPVHIAPWGRSGVGGPQGDWRQHFIAAFALLNLVTHCEYTGRAGDCALAYDSLKGAAEWWRFYLVKEPLPHGGYRYVDPNDCTNEGCDGEIQFNGLIPLALARRVLSWLIASSVSRGIDADLRSQWLEQVEHLSALPTTSGRPPFADLAIFNAAEDNSTSSTPRPDDNPLAVYPIWPAGLLSIHSNSTLATVALNTVRIYTGGWTQPNALPVFQPAAVRIGYPASDIVAGWAARVEVCLLPNLFCYQAGGGVETSGATMAVNEMLMQSNEWALNLFPVWPANLSAAFEGMRARGNILVAAAYNASQGEVSGVELEAEDPVAVRLMHPWQWTQAEKEQRARARLAGQRPMQRGRGELPALRVVRVGKDGEEVEAAGVHVHHRPPTKAFAHEAGYEISEEVVWVEWVACSGCRYRVLREASGKGHNPTSTTQWRAAVH